MLSRAGFRRVSGPAPAPVRAGAQLRCDPRAAADARRRRRWRAAIPLYDTVSQCAACSSRTASTCTGGLPHYRRRSQRESLTNQERQGILDDVEVAAATASTASRRRHLARLAQCLARRGAGLRRREPDHRRRSRPQRCTPRTGRRPRRRAGPRDPRRLRPPILPRPNEVMTMPPTHTKPTAAEDANAPTSGSTASTPLSSTSATPATSAQSSPPTRPSPRPRRTCARPSPTRGRPETPGQSSASRSGRASRPRTSGSEHSSNTELAIPAISASGTAGRATSDQQLCRLRSSPGR